MHDIDLLLEVNNYPQTSDMHHIYGQ